MRWDSASGQYDMGFRNYAPGLNQFLSRDMYNGALADMQLTTDPFTGNRYTFGAGNPISNIELDGHGPTNQLVGYGACGQSGNLCPERGRDSLCYQTQQDCNYGNLSRDITQTGAGFVREFYKNEVRGPGIGPLAAMLLPRDLSIGKPARARANKTA